jgi:hypothetical protein
MVKTEFSFQDQDQAVVSILKDDIETDTDSETEDDLQLHIRFATSLKKNTKRKRRTIPPKISFSNSSEQQNITDLRDVGVVVIRLFSNEEVLEFKEMMDKMLQEFPEFKKSAMKFVFGAFGALGNPASFHHPFVRKIRLLAYNKLKSFWSQVAKNSGEKKWHMMIDRVVNTRGTMTAEPFHRDEATSSNADQVYGGWVNLGFENQYFNAVPRTHKTSSKQAGFSVVKDDEKTCIYEAACKSYTIPPGCVVIFQSNIVHTVVGGKTSPGSARRLYIGWHVTDKGEPLTEREELIKSIQDQGVIRLPSGQIPPMYAKMNWVFKKQRLQLAKFAQHMDERCLDHKHVLGGQEKGACYKIPQREMKSLKEYGMPLYTPYSKEEIDALLPC